MRGIVIVLVLGYFPLIGGCITTATRHITVLKPLNLDIFDGQQIVIVEVTQRGPATIEEANLFSRRLVQRLDETNQFSEVNLQQNTARTANLLVQCDIVAIRRVHINKRKIGGGLVGRASIDVHVRLISPLFGSIVGEVTVKGLSSGGTAFSGTTEDAMEKATEAIVDYVMGK